MAFVTVPSFSIFEVLEHVNVVMVASSLLKMILLQFLHLKKYDLLLLKYLISSLLISALPLAVELIVKSFEPLSNFNKTRFYFKCFISADEEVILRLLLSMRFIEILIHFLEPYSFFSQSMKKIHHQFYIRRKSI